MQSMGRQRLRPRTLKFNHSTMLIFDCHTHQCHQPYAIINAEASNIAFDEHLHYSAGIHPWWIENSSESIISATMQLAASTRNVVAIGECGIDHAISTPLNIQHQIFENTLPCRRLQTNLLLFTACVPGKKCWLCIALPNRFSLGLFTASVQSHL